MSSSKASLIASLPEAEREAIFSKMSPERQRALIYDWDFWSRPEQRAPTHNPRRTDGKWSTWLLLSGRGFGKTRSAAEFVRERVEAGRCRSIGLIGQTAADTRKVMVEGVSGLMAVCPPWNKPVFEPSNSRLVWPSGAMAHLFSAEEPDKLRGPNFDLCWYDEICAFGTPKQAKDVYDMGTMCLRIPGPRGDPPLEIITTTPKPMPLLREIKSSPYTVITGGR
jgi:phage terminase large subunit-like protein